MRIYVLIGKSASGKDTLYGELLADNEISLKPYVIYTTRPMRDGESEGVEYHFTDEKNLERLEAAGCVIEKRVYHTVYGDWFYFTVDDEHIDLEYNDYLYIGTLESYEKMRDHYGSDVVVPLYIEVEDGIRLERALARERQRQTPGYAELCRRFLSDAEDFSEEKIAHAGIKERYDNMDGGECLKALKAKIQNLRFRNTVV